MTPEALPQLVEDCAAGTLSPALRAELAEAFAGDERLRADFVLQLRALQALDAAFHPVAADAELARRVAYLIDRSRDSQAVRTIQGVQQRLARRRRTRSRAWAWSLASAASVAVLAGLVGLVLVLARPASQETGALTVTVEGAVQLVRDGASSRLSDGMVLREGDRISLEPQGQASLRWDDDETRVVLSDRGDLTISDLGGSGGSGGDSEGKRLHLDAGRLSASVTRQPTGRPLVISTPHGTASVVGTRFSLAVDADSTSLQVDEGVVGLQSTPSSPALEVPAGERAIADGGGVRLAAASAAPAPGSWVDLFRDGGLGWKTTRGSWHLEQGVAVLQGSDSHGTRLESGKSYTDFELTCRMRVVSGRTYSEIQIHSYSYTVAIHDTVADFAWKTVHVLVQGDHLEATCDGQPLTWLRTGQPSVRSGSLAFFVGADRRLEITDVRLRELPAP